MQSLKRVTKRSVSVANLLSSNVQTFYFEELQNDKRVLKRGRSDGRSSSSVRAVIIHMQHPNQAQ